MHATCSTWHNFFCLETSSPVDPADGLAFVFVIIIIVVVVAAVVVIIFVVVAVRVTLRRRRSRLSRLRKRCFYCSSLMKFTRSTY